MLSSAVLTFADPYEYQRSIRATDVEVFVTAPGEYRAGLTRIVLHQLWMQRSQILLPQIFHSVMRKGRKALFFLADLQQKPIYHSGMELAAGDVMVYSPRSEHHMRFPTESHWGAMSLSPEDLATAGRALIGRDLSAPAVTHLIRPRPDVMSRLLQLHEAAGHLAATAPDILAHPEVAKAIEQELIRAMVACLTEPTAADKHRSRPKRLSVLRRFEQMLETKKDESIYITDVCAEIGVTARTLRLYCQEHLGMSPHQYLWLRRMNLVRRALTRADPATTTVTAIANDHGFGELGRFAVTYRRLFGESPSATLRQPPNELPSPGTSLRQRSLSGSA